MHQLAVMTEIRMILSEERENLEQFYEQVIANTGLVDIICYLF